MNILGTVFQAERAAGAKALKWLHGGVGGGRCGWAEQMMGREVGHEVGMGATQDPVDLPHDSGPEQRSDHVA